MREYRLRTLTMLESNRPELYETRLTALGTKAGASDSDVGSREHRSALARAQTRVQRAADGSAIYTVSGMLLGFGTAVAGVEPDEID